MRILAERNFPKRLLALALIPFALAGTVVVITTVHQLRSERQRHRNEVLELTALQVENKVKDWGDVVRTLALASDADIQDPARAQLFMADIMARFPDIATLQLCDTAGRKVGGLRREGTLSWPDLSLESSHLRHVITGMKLWAAPVHDQNEGFPRLPIVASVQRRNQPAGFLIAEFQMASLHTIVKRAPVPLLLTNKPYAVKNGPGRSLTELGWSLILLEPESSFPKPAWVVALVFLVGLLTFLIGWLERRWSAQAARTIAHQQRLMAIGATASAIGHELRTALAVIRNAVEALKNRVDPLDPKILKQIETMETQVRLSNRLLSDLMEFARPQQITLKPANIHSVIENVLAGLKLPDPIHVSTQLNAVVSDWPMDADRMGQAISNVVLNAADAMAEGGTLTIATRDFCEMPKKSSSRHVFGRDRGIQRIRCLLLTRFQPKTCWNDESIHFATVPTRVSDGQVIVEFHDTGPGIAPDVRKRLYEPFFTTKARGMGLGLSIVKKIIELHGGSLEIETKPGQGTTVSFRLPVAERSAASAVPSEPDAVGRFA